MTNTNPAAANVEIRERVWRTAYARNGNAGNPTQYKCWDLYLNGRLHLVGLKYREAVRLADELKGGR